MSGTPIGSAGNIGPASRVSQVSEGSDVSASLIRRGITKEQVAEKVISGPVAVKKISKEEMIKDLKIINGLELPADAGMGSKIGHWFKMTFNKSDAMRNAEVSIAALERNAGIGKKVETMPIEIAQKTIMPPKVNPDTVESAEHKKLLQYFEPPKGSIENKVDARKLLLSSQENSLALLSYSREALSSENIEFVLDLRKAISKPVPDQTELRNLFSTYLLKDSDKPVNISSTAKNDNKEALDSGDPEKILKAINKSLTGLNNCLNDDLVSKYKIKNPEIFQRHEVSLKVNELKQGFPPEINKLLGMVKNEALLQKMMEFGNKRNVSENFGFAVELGKIVNKGGDVKKADLGNLYNRYLDPNSREQINTDPKECVKFKQLLDTGDISGAVGKLKQILTGFCHQQHVVQLTTDFETSDFHRSYQKSEAFNNLSASFSPSVVELISMVKNEALLGKMLEFGRQDYSTENFTFGVELNKLLDKDESVKKEDLTGFYNRFLAPGSQELINTKPNECLKFKQLLDADDLPGAIRQIRPILTGFTNDRHLIGLIKKFKESSFNQ